MDFDNGCTCTEEYYDNGSNECISCNEGCITCNVGGSCAGGVCK